MSIINGELKYECLREASNSAVEQGELDEGDVDKVATAVIKEVDGGGSSYSQSLNNSPNDKTLHPLKEEAKSIKEQ